MKSIIKKMLMTTLLAGSMAIVACGGNGGEEAWRKEPDEPDNFFPASSVTHKVTFNYGDKTEEKTVQHGHKVAKPADPTAPAGKKFYGWLNKANGGQIWNFNRNKLNSVFSDITLEPLFVDANLKPQYFDAELCPDICANGGMDGATYSGGNSGLGLIYRDYDKEFTSHAYSDKHVGAFVHYLYVKGDTLTWELESDKDANNVVLMMRLGAEYGLANEAGDDVTCGFNDTEFPVTVNGTAMKYGEITLHNVSKDKSGVFDNKGVFLPLQDYLVSASVSLKAGKNTIQMKVDNDKTINGTISSSAPCVDCITLFSNSKLTWPNADLENLSYLELGD